MLELLDEELEDALQRQEAQLELSVRLVFAPTGLNIRGKGIDLAEQLGLNGAQAFSLIERLVQDEYIRGKTESATPLVQWAEPSFTASRTRG